MNGYLNNTNQNDIKKKNFFFIGTIPFSRTNDWIQDHIFAKQNH